MIPSHHRPLTLLSVLLVLVFTSACSPEGPAEPWQESAPLPQPRGEMHAAVIGSEIFVSGGLHGLTASSSDALFILDLETETWRQAAPMPVGLNHHAAAAWDGQLYVFGGSETIVSINPLDTTLIYDPGSDSWSEGAPMPAVRWGHAAAVLDDGIYVAGGHGPEPEQAFRYDPAADTWETIASLSQPRDHLGVVAWDGLIYAVGGRWHGENTDRVEIYDPAVGAWQPGPPLNQARSGMGVAVSPAGIHAVGGEAMQALGGLVFATHELLADLDEGWQVAPPVRPGRHGSPAVVIGEDLYLIGGAWRQGMWSVFTWLDRVERLETGHLHSP